MKKITSLILTLLMVLSLGVTGFAQPILGSITIQNESSKTGVSMKGHTYSAYQILDATKDGEKYSYSVKDEYKEFFKSKADNDVDTDAKLDRFVTDYIKNLKDIHTFTKELMEYIGTKKLTTDHSSDKVNESNGYEKVTISSLPIGYYLVLDSGNKDVKPEDKGNTTVIAAASLATADTNITINLKASAPTIKKEIAHNDNSGNFGPVGDNKIGDFVYFRLTATLPSDITGYKDYIYTMHDTMGKGFTFNMNQFPDGDFYGVATSGGHNDLVYINKKYYTLEEGKHNDTFDLKINVKALIEDNVVRPGGTIQVFYRAMLNENALIAGEANENKVNLEYSNNPNDDDKTTTTPDETVKDYTFKINALKTSEDGVSALPGAEFELSRDVIVHYGKRYTKADGTNVYVVCGQKHDHPDGTQQIISGSNGRFEIIGLDDNIEYTLTETKAPDGYYPINPIKFKIQVTYKEDGSIEGITTTNNGISKEDGSFELATTIVNTTGGKLPETGGMGTTMFIVAGAGLMIVAAGALIFKKRSN